MKDRKRYPIICRVSMRYRIIQEGARKYKSIEFSTGLSLSNEEWDSDRQRACTTHDKKRGLKACIDHMYINSTIERIYERCRLITEDIRGREFDGLRVSLDEAREAFTSDDTLYRLRGIQELPTLTAGVLEWLSDKNDSDITSDGTKASRRNTLNHLRAYHEATTPNTPLCWETLTRDYIEQFRSWLITERGLSNTTTNKQIKTMSTFLMWANGAGKVTAPMKLGKLKEQTDGGKMYLSTEDIDALCDLELTGAERDTRDWFIISCCTGLRVGDLQGLTTDNLIPVTGKDWVYELIHRQEKTKKAVSVPIVVPQVVRVLERLQRQFPVKRTAQYLNKTIKGIAKRAGLNARTEGLDEETGIPLRQYEAITMHTGRRSFATNAYKAGVPLTTIQAKTGYSDINTLEIYLRRSTEEKKEAFAHNYTR
jgi:hypothetical protein